MSLHHSTLVPLKTKLCEIIELGDGGVDDNNATRWASWPVEGVRAPSSSPLAPSLFIGAGGVGGDSGGGGDGRAKGNIQKFLGLLSLGAGGGENLPTVRKFGYVARIGKDGDGGGLIWNTAYPINPSETTLLGSKEPAQVNLRGNKGINFFLVIFEPLTSTLEGRVLGVEDCHCLLVSCVVERVKDKDKVGDAKDVTSPAVTVEPVVKGKLSTSVDTGIANGENTCLRSYLHLPTQGSTPASNTPCMSSYANVTYEPSRKALNFRALYTSGANGVYVVVPVESIRAVSERFANTAYSFFLGKRVAYPVVANYVRNTWGKYGRVKSMLNSSTGLFSFQFSTIDGLNEMHENGPWFIQKHPLILKNWNPNVNLLKEDVGNVSVWVKLHGVPVTTFSEDGLSERSSYTRVMIELKADVELKDTIAVAMPKLTREGFYTLGCGNMKKPSETPKGVPVGTKVLFKPAKEYRPLSKKHTANTSVNKKKDVQPTKKVSNSNPFDVLNSVENDIDLGTNRGLQICEDEVASVDNDMARSMASKKVGYGQEIPDKLQAICDNLDIKVRGRKKK
ncbi:retrotransposon protein, putative, ty1-copia subclass [Tanacetum coccineum]